MVCRSYLCFMFSEASEHRNPVKKEMEKMVGSVMPTSIWKKYFRVSLLRVLFKLQCYTEVFVTWGWELLVSIPSNIC